MSLISDVRAYETWLRTRCIVDEAGLRMKHVRMAADVFRFFRATCFRFARTIDGVAADLRDAPIVPSVGDAHIENWGTWRDGEGRLVWGVNDFDDAALLPYTFDLARLAASSRLAPGLPGTRRDRASHILAGYHRGLRKPGPIFADDERPWLQGLVLRPSAKAGTFRAFLEGLESADPCRKARAALSAALPKEARIARYAKQQRGGGSLGRPRYLAIGRWQGGPIVREAKVLVPSSWDWAAGRTDQAHLSLRLARGAYRASDPFLRLDAGFIVRRLAPDSAKIDLAEEDATEFGADLLSGMGSDLAAIHAADGAAVSISSDLRRRPEGWLHRSAKAIAASVHEDFDRWAAHAAKGYDTPR